MNLREPAPRYLVAFSLALSTLSLIAIGLLALDVGSLRKELIVRNNRRDVTRKRGTDQVVQAQTQLPPEYLDRIEGDIARIKEEFRNWNKFKKEFRQAEKYFHLSVDYENPDFQKQWIEGEKEITDGYAVHPLNSNIIKVTRIEQQRMDKWQHFPNNRWWVEDNNLIIRSSHMEKEQGYSRGERVGALKVYYH